MRPAFHIWVRFCYKFFKMRWYTEFAQFSKIAQYLVNPLVLVGFCLFLVFGTYRALLNTGLLTPLSQRQSLTVIRLLLRYGFQTALGLVLLGLTYAGLRTYHDANREHDQKEAITQQTGPCGSNIVGDKNKTTIDCTDNSTKTKWNPF